MARQLTICAAGIADNIQFGFEVLLAFPHDPFDVVEFTGAFHKMITRFSNTPISRAILSGFAVFAVTAVSIPAAAQGTEEARIRKIESEVRALQRTVFPGGAGRFFEPEISTATTEPSRTVANSTTAVTDILARLDALESQLQGLTAQTEQNTNSVSLLTGRIAALEAGGTSPVPVDISAPAPAVNSPAVTSVAATPAAGPTASRLAAVQEIAKPQTDDAGDDEYSYGYRLWNAGFYPEAQQQLTLFVEKYPSHSRLTFGRNLLGRAYLDGGKPKEAAPWFLRNYQSDKQAARAPDSLLYLAETMIVQNDTNRACIALAEFGETYPALASGRLADQYQSNLRKVKCD
jgi:TolA-binding protein